MASEEVKRASASEAFRLELASDLARIREHDPLIRECGDARAVHQARVAARRVRSQIRSFEKVLRKRETAAVASKLRLLAASLGEVRDRDVTARRLAAPIEGFEQEPVLALLATEREAAMRRLLAALDSASYGKLLRLLDGLVASSPLRARFAERPAADVLMPQLANALARLEEEAGKLGPAPADAELHRLRILAKRARYAAELVAPFDPAAPTIRALAKGLASLQDVLGEWHDAVRAAAWLEGALPRLVAGRTTGSDPLVAVELLLAREHSASAGARSGWREALELAVELKGRPPPPPEPVLASGS